MLLGLRFFAFAIVLLKRLAPASGILVRCIRDSGEAKWGKEIDGIRSSNGVTVPCHIVLPACVLILLRYLWDEFYATNAAQSSKNRG